MIESSNRREFILGTAALIVAATGCERSPDEVLRDSPTPVVQGTKVVLRGFQIVSLRAGGKLIHLPHPAARILGACLVISSVAAELVVEYLDEELQRREIRERVSEEMRLAIEDSRSITAIREDHIEEPIALGPNQYLGNPAAQ